SRYVGVRTQVTVKFNDQCLAESHDFRVGLALWVEVGAALGAAHGQGGEGILEGLLEGQELEDGLVHRGVKTHAALEGADGRIVLDAERAVGANIALV